MAFARSEAPTSGAAFDGPSDVYIRPLASGDERLVATGVWPVTSWAPSGGSLLARSADGRELLVIDPSGVNATVRLSIPDGVGAFSWQAIVR